MLCNRIKSYDKLFADVQRLHEVYFRKCRSCEELLESGQLEQEDKQDHDNRLHSEATSEHSNENTNENNGVGNEDEEDEEDEQLYEFADSVYPKAQVKTILKKMLIEIPQSEEKIRFLGTFSCVVAGEAVVRWILKNFSNASVKFAEEFGQDLMRCGFLRHLGVGRTFANSAVLKYQWKDKAFELADMTDVAEEAKKKAVNVTSVGDWIATSLASVQNDEDPCQRGRREAIEANGNYKLQVENLDKQRMAIEETIMEQYKFMEVCERERLNLIKNALLTMTVTISNIGPNLKSSVDNMLLFQETVNADNDLRFVLENYRTGIYTPKVITYENYRGSTTFQSFGVDLSLRARLDRAEIPHLVTFLLSHLEKMYKHNGKDYELWLLPMKHFQAAHRLRVRLNGGKFKIHIGPAAIESLLT